MEAYGVSRTRTPNAEYTEEWNCNNFKNIIIINSFEIRVNERTNERTMIEGIIHHHFYPLIRKTHHFIFAVNTSIFLAVVYICTEDVHKKNRKQIHGFEEQREHSTED